MDQAVVEVVTFRLKPEVEEVAFVEANGAVNRWLGMQAGFIARELLKDAENQWIDIVHWRSMNEAHAAATAIMHEPSAAPLMTQLDGSSMTMRHYARIIEHRNS